MSVNREDSGRPETVYGEATKRDPTPKEKKAVRNREAHRRNGKQPDEPAQSKKNSIHITQVEIENFKSFSDRKTTIPFKEGCTCISGPHGSGKSTIIEAIRFALLLEPFMDSEGYINTKSKNDEAAVSVTFSDGTHIRRRIRQTPILPDSLYYLNHKISSPEKIHKRLESMGIRPNGYTIVTYDDINRILFDRVLFRRCFECLEIIDEIAGIDEFNEWMMEKQNKVRTIQRKIARHVSKLAESVEKLKELSDMRRLENLLPYRPSQNTCEKIRTLTEELQKQSELLIREHDELDRKVKIFHEEKESRFMTAFNAVNANFQNLYHELTGHEGQLILEKSPVYAPRITMAISAITMEISLNGNKTRSLDMLSCSEKSIAALSFILAVQQYLPAPVYIFDDADATLDDGNTELFAQKIRAISEKSQVIIVSHRKPVIDASDYQMDVSINPKDRSTLVTGIREKTKAD